MSDRSVFVDPTGKRRKSVRTAAIVGVGSLTTVGALLVAALAGAPIGPNAWLPVAPPPPSVTAEAVPASGAAPVQRAPSRTFTRSSGPTTTTAKQQPKSTTASTTTTTTTTDAVTTTKSKPGNPNPGRPTDHPRPTKP